MRKAYGECNNNHELCSRYKLPNGEMEEKMDKFIVNVIHRPEMVPEYAEKVTGHGKEAQKIWREKSI